RRALSRGVRERMEARGRARDLQPVDREDARSARTPQLGALCAVQRDRLRGSLARPSPAAGSHRLTPPWRRARTLPEARPTPLRPFVATAEKRREAGEDHPEEGGQMSHLSLGLFGTSRLRFARSSTRAVRSAQNGMKRELNRKTRRREEIDLANSSRLP